MIGLCDFAPYVSLREIKKTNSEKDDEECDATGA